MGPAQAFSFGPIVLNAANTPGFRDMLAARRLVFVLNACMGAFAGKSHARVRTVGARRTGRARALWVRCELCRCTCLARFSNGSRWSQACAKGTGAPAMVLGCRQSSSALPAAALLQTKPHPSRMLLLPAPQVNITLTGAKGLKASSLQSVLTLGLSHLGRSEVVSDLGARQVYAHLARYAVHSYDVNSGRVVTQVSRFGSKLCLLSSLPAGPHGRCGVGVPAAGDAIRASRCEKKWPAAFTQTQLMTHVTKHPGPL